MLSTAIPTENSDPVNARVLSVEHLASLGIPVLYTNVFWGGRSEIKPSEVSPVEYERWCVRTGMDPGTMRAGSD